MELFRRLTDGYLGEGIAAGMNYSILLLKCGVGARGSLAFIDTSNIEEGWLYL